jgi:hypothetical protein
MASIAVAIYSVVLLWLQTKSADLALGLAGADEYGRYANLLFFASLWSAYVITAQGNDSSRVVARLRETPSWQQELYDFTSGLTLTRGVAFHILSCIGLSFLGVAWWHVLAFVAASLVSAYSSTCTEVEFYTGRWGRYVMRSATKPVTFIITLLLLASRLNAIDALVLALLAASLSEFVICHALGFGAIVRRSGWRPAMANEGSALVDIISSQSDRLFALFEPNKAFFANVAVLSQLRTGIFTMIKPLSRHIWLSYLGRRDDARVRNLRLVTLATMFAACFLPPSIIRGGVELLHLPNLAPIAAEYFPMLVAIAACAFAGKKELASLVLAGRDNHLFQANSISAVCGAAVVGIGVLNGEIATILVGLAIRYLVHRLLVLVFSLRLSRCWSIDVGICSILLALVQK